MSKIKDTRLRWISALHVLPVLFFILLGITFAPRAGLEDDEALIVSGAYPQPGSTYVVNLFGHQVPLMLMSYLGALKSWIYAPILAFWKSSPITIRLPAILLGAITIVLFRRLLSSLTDNLTSVIGTLLLTTDTIFFLTTCFDWGPVALQHFLTVSGLLCIVHFHQSNKRIFLGIGFFLFGLALWDKALFAWTLMAVILASITVFPKEIGKHLSRRNIIIIMICFSLGATPFIIYNIDTRLGSFRTNVSYSTAQFSQKLANLVGAFTGKALFGYLVRGDSPAPHGSPKTIVETTSVTISRLAGRPKSGYLGYATLAAVLLLPIVRSRSRRRIALFCFITMLFMLGQMLVVKGAGMGAHHVILLWPFPILAISVIYRDIMARFPGVGRVVVIAAVVIVALMNLLVTNEYLALFIENGPGLFWSDAIFPLSEYLEASGAKTIYLNDWGMLDILWLVGRGQLPLRPGNDVLMKSRLEPSEREVAIKRITEAGALFVSHTDGNEVFRGVNANMNSICLNQPGCQREILIKIADRHGRYIYDVFHFLHRPGSPSSPQKGP